MCASASTAASTSSSFSTKTGPIPMVGTSSCGHVTCQAAPSASPRLSVVLLPSVPRISPITGTLSPWNCHPAGCAALSLSITTPMVGPKVSAWKSDAEVGIRRSGRGLRGAPGAWLAMHRRPPCPSQAARRMSKARTQSRTRGLVGSGKEARINNGPRRMLRCTFTCKHFVEQRCVLSRLTRRLCAGSAGRSGAQLSTTSTSYRTRKSK